MDEITFTKEMLEKVLGGVNVHSNAKVYTFTGAYAEAQANNVIKLNKFCGCSCLCNEGAGSGAGAGS